MGRKRNKTVKAISTEHVIEEIQEGFYQLNETVRCGAHCFKEGEVVKIIKEYKTLLIQNREGVTGTIKAADVPIMKSILCKTSNLKTYEKKLAKYKRRHPIADFLDDVGDFLTDPDHIVFHTLVIMIATVVAIIAGGVATQPLFESENPPEDAALLQVLIQNPVAKISAIVTVVLIVLYILRSIIGNWLEDVISDIPYDKDRKRRDKIESDLYACGDAMIPISGEKKCKLSLSDKNSDVPLLETDIIDTLPDLLESEEEEEEEEGSVTKEGTFTVKASSETFKTKEKVPVEKKKKVFPEIPKVEIKEPVITLEEYSGLYLYRTDWEGKTPPKGRKPRHKKAS